MTGLLFEIDEPVEADEHLPTNLTGAVDAPMQGRVVIYDGSTWLVHSLGKSPESVNLIGADSHVLDVHHKRLKYTSGAPVRWPRNKGKR